MAVIELTQENFDSEVTNSDETILIDFWANWCAPCRMIAPVVDELAEEYPNIKVCKINVDKQLELARRFKVTSIPMLVLIKEKNVVNTLIGVVPKKSIIEMLGL